MSTTSATELRGQAHCSLTAWCEFYPEDGGTEGLIDKITKRYPPFFNAATLFQKFDGCIMCPTKQFY